MMEEMPWVHFLAQVPYLRVDQWKADFGPEIGLGPGTTL